jgi:hypothetical protein
MLYTGKFAGVLFCMYILLCKMHISPSGECVPVQYSEKVGIYFYPSTSGPLNSNATLVVV